jgi:glyceraldehyde 3-phosphate dehydrogenase
LPDPVKATETKAERAPVPAGRVIRLTDAKTIAVLPLADLGADLVIDGTGVFKTGAKVAPSDAGGG